MKKRLNYDAIYDKEKRNITYCKRKKGVIKKAIQLSKLCELDIFMVIFDRQKQKLFEYRSENDFDVDICKRMLKNDLRWQLSHKLETNNDFNAL